MTTTLFFVRHVPHELQDRVQVGRLEDIELGPCSPVQLAALAERFRGEDLDAVYASPVSRAQETAAAIAGPHGLEVRTRHDLHEIDAGEWTGLDFDALKRDPRYHAWNDARAENRIPGGESMLEMQLRMVHAVEAVRAEHPGGRAVLVSHGDPIKAALLYFLGLPLDAYRKIEVEPASISTLTVDAGGSKLIRLNEAAPAVDGPADGA